MYECSLTIDTTVFNINLHFVLSIVNRKGRPKFSEIVPD